MSDTSDMAAIREALTFAMRAQGAKAKPLSVAAGLGPTAVRDILAPNSTDVKVSTLSKLADVLHVPLDTLLVAGKVPLTGRIGAGGSIAYADTGVDEMVARPPGIAGALEALEVVGDSMLPRYSQGDVIYIKRTHDGVMPDYLGEYCAILTEEGEHYLKVLSRGSREGRFTLRSLNAADIEDVRIVWATPVLFVLPRYARIHMGTI